VKSAGGWTGT